MPIETSDQTICTDLPEGGSLAPERPALFLPGAARRRSVRITISGDKKHGKDRLRAV
ncbi:hypothetical protein [Verminephrobacter eiseniae]|uniref:hypothetical protein n=1 Tax=Verminephrobacter eiseniae TaxID=364317 RepID=UPI0022390333|nr:hypothetical protein [Verminephrobacter eiseniae]